MHLKTRREPRRVGGCADMWCCGVFGAVEGVGMLVIWCWRSIKDEDGSRW